MLLLKDYIDLIARAVSPKEYICIQTSIVMVLENFRYNKGLEDITPIRMNEEFLCSLDTEKSADEARIHEIKLRAFNEALAKIFIERP